MDTRHAMELRAKCAARAAKVEDRYRAEDHATANAMAAQWVDDYELLTLDPETLELRYRMPDGTAAVDRRIAVEAWRWLHIERLYLGGALSEEEEAAR